MVRPGSPTAPLALAVAALLGGACGQHQAETVIGVPDAGIPDAATPDARATADALGDARPPCVRGGTTALVPTIVACGPGLPMHLAVDGVNLYWTDRRAGAVVYKAPLAGGAPTVLAYDDAPAEGLALGNTYVYFTQPAKSRVVRVPKAGGATRVIAAGLDAPAFLALAFPPEGPTLYWTGGARQGEGKIMRISLAVGALPETLVDGQSQPRALAVSNGFVYWTDGWDGTVLRAPDHPDPAAETRVATRLAAGLKTPSDIVLVNGYAYVPDVAGRIIRVPLDGGALETVAKVPGFPFGIASDGVSVYWTTTGKGGVFKAPLGANVRTSTIVEGEAEARFLAASPDDVYWGAWGEGGTVRRMAKLGRPAN